MDWGDFQIGKRPPRLSRRLFSFFLVSAPSKGEAGEGGGKSDKHALIDPLSERT